MHAHSKCPPCGREGHGSRSVDAPCLPLHLRLSLTPGANWITLSPGAYTSNQLLHTYSQSFTHTHTYSRAHVHVQSHKLHNQTLIHTGAARPSSPLLPLSITLVRCRISLPHTAAVYGNSDLCQCVLPAIHQCRGPHIAPPITTTVSSIRPRLAAAPSQAELGWTGSGRVGGGGGQW